MSSRINSYFGHLAATITDERNEVLIVFGDDANHLMDYGNYYTYETCWEYESKIREQLQKTIHLKLKTYFPVQGRKIIL